MDDISKKSVFGCFQKEIQLVLHLSCQNLILKVILRANVIDIRYMLKIQNYVDFFQNILKKLAC